MASGVLGVPASPHCLHPGEQRQGPVPVGSWGAAASLAGWEELWVSKRPASLRVGGQAPPLAYFLLELQHEKRERTARPYTAA